MSLRLDDLVGATRERLDARKRDVPLAELAEAQYAGEIATRDEAISYATSHLRGASGPAS